MQSCSELSQINHPVIPYLVKESIVLVIALGDLYLYMYMWHVSGKDFSVPLMRHDLSDLDH